ncbi:hypothetical protein GFS60_00444 [Rhodococcus sp. WAY2]|nr:hypothetical protein GFS60_00444 [Rhodococcus sp. WAY2]
MQSRATFSGTGEIGRIGQARSPVADLQISMQERHISFV